MWSTKAPPTRYEAILKALELTDEAIDNASSSAIEMRLVSQRRDLVEALANDEDLPEEEEEEGEGEDVDSHEEDPE